jgi:hypothetical protein
MKHFALILALTSLCYLARADYSANLKTIIVNVVTPEGELRTEIHFAEKDIAVARRAEEIIRTDLTKAVEYFHHVPRDVVHINIDPYKRLTNGNATIFPTNIINLFNFPASNLEHLITLEDWLQGLLFHEFVHIVHLDQTGGYLEVGRNIFGTIAKVPSGVVPRWFTEGVAVWAESHFLQGGRLQNTNLNKDLWLQFHDQNFCSSIDCLDEPGVYPHGQLAYWAGGHFMNYLEIKNPNTIRCLVLENSKEVPFFLNEVFQKCTGLTAEELFREFKDDYLKKFTETDVVKENVKNIFGIDDFQKGQVRIGDLLLKVERQKKTSALVKYDLKNNISSFHIFSVPIDFIGYDVKLENASAGVLVAFNDDPHFMAYNKTWKIINADTLLEEKTLAFAHDPSYVLPFSDNSFLTFTYEENHWRAFLNEKLIKEWPLKYNIVGVEKNSDQVILKINTANIGTGTYISDQNLGEISQDGKKVEFNDNISNLNESQVQSYPEWYHFKPHYWFLAFGNSNSPGSIGAMTTFSDPMMIHLLSASALVYPSVNQLGGAVNYTFTDHFWQHFILLSRDYSLNSWSEMLNKADEAVLGTSYQLQMKKWLYIPQINIGKSSTKDVFSTQQNISGAFINSLAYQALSSHDFWQSFSASLELGASTRTIGDPYNKLQTKINTSTAITDDFSLSLKMSYGKLYKKQFSDGILYGGGFDQLQITRRFEFYGIPYGDAYGNEIMATQVRHDFNFLNIYRGRNFIPLFLKEAHLLFGIEGLSADRIYINNTFYKNEKIKSLFVGTKLTTNLFYYVPTNFNLIYSSTRAPDGSRIGLFNFFLQLDL